METKIIKVTNKGQISIPVVIRSSLNISEGDELILTRANDAIILKKINQDDFKDILIHSEKSLKKVWDNKEDEIWNSYLK
ncbi:MAG: AbrB/MazE/SpoVT family DNA-binding domain-containing protein [Nanoarchaeota archaeon]